MPKNADAELNAQIPSQVPEQLEARKEPDYKVAFEIAAGQRDKANQNLCNMQIDLAMALNENEELKKENADLKAKLTKAEK